MIKYALYENNRQWQDVFNRLFSVCVNIFEWTGLPETCDEWFIEQTLLWRGECCIIYDESRGGFLSLPCTPASAQNLYYENSYYRATSLGYTKEFMALTKYNKDIFDKILPYGNTNHRTLTKGVVCQDNITKYPLHETICIYTDKIVDAMRSIDVVAKQLKIPSLIEADEATLTSIQQAVDNIDTNVQAVYTTKNVANKFRETKPIQTFVEPNTMTTLWNHLNNTESKLLTAFGVNNLHTADKKERLLTDEINSNNENIAMNVAYRLDQRLHFCENFNSVFPEYNISCRIRHDFEEKMKVGDDKNGDV